VFDEMSNWKSLQACNPYIANAQQTSTPISNGIAAYIQAFAKYRKAKNAEFLSQ
jgi:hypothetical protein